MTVFRIGQMVPSSNTTMETEIPAMLRLREPVAPERFTTVRLALSTVVNLRSHWVHCRRRRTAVPSSAVRLSTTRESSCRQNGQCIGDSFQ